MRLVIGPIKGMGISIALTIAGLVAFVAFMIFGTLRLSLRLFTGGALIGAIFSGIGLLRDGWHAHSWLANTFQDCGVAAVLGLLVIVVCQQFAERHLPARAR